MPRSFAPAGPLWLRHEIPIASFQLSRFFRPCALFLLRQQMKSAQRILWNSFRVPWHVSSIGETERHRWSTGGIKGMARVIFPSPKPIREPFALPDCIPRLRACLKIPRGAVFAQQAGWRGATKETAVRQSAPLSLGNLTGRAWEAHTPGGSSTERTPPFWGLMRKETSK